jgi:hypothetical protein
MQRLILLVFLATGLVLAGCRTQQSSGRLDQLIISEAHSYGGGKGLLPNDKLMVGTWTVKRDNYGTVIHCTGVSFESLDQFFRNCYGDPHYAGKNEEGKAQWAIPAKVAGVSFWYSELAGGLEITVLKPFHWGP